MKTKAIKILHPILSDRKKIIIIDIISYSFFTLFLYAAASKILDYNNFKVQLSKSPIVTEFASIIAWALPVVESIIAVLLLITKTKLLGLYGSFTLMVLFTSYIIGILNFSNSIPCSCGGILERMGWTDHLIFNAFFVLISMIGIFLHTTILKKG